MTNTPCVAESEKPAELVVAFSLSFDRSEGLPRGLGAEHLREALIHIARPLLRQQAALSYGGSLEPMPPPEINFTLELLNLIREEQQERSTGNTSVRRLYNFQAWPNYLDLKREQEAEWINCCQIIRVTQEMAGFAKPLPDISGKDRTPIALIHAAVCLSKMRRCMAAGCGLKIEGAPARDQPVPAISARIVLGGKMSDFSGIMPGIFEEVLTMREANPKTPIFILGGFSGAAGALASVLLEGGVNEDPRFRTDTYTAPDRAGKQTKLAQVHSEWDPKKLPEDARSPEEGFAALRKLLDGVEKRRADFLHNGLSDEDNRRLLKTVDPTEAVRLVLRGLRDLLKGSGAAGGGVGAT